MAPRAVLVRTALAVAAWSAAFTFLVQCENLWLAAWGLGALRGSRLLLLAVFPFAQLPLLAVSAALGLAAAIAARWRRGRGVALVVLGVVHLLVVFDQTAYRLFGEHMSVSQVDGGWHDLRLTLPALLGSALHAITALFWLNLGALAFVVWRFHRALQGAPGTSAVPTWWRTAAAGGLSYALLSVPVSRLTDTRHLDEYPLAHLLGTASRSAPGTAGSRGPLASLVHLRDSTWRDDSAAARSLASAASAFATPSERPNIVLVVLESVGSEQLLPGGRFSRDTTPMFASRAAHAVVFPNVYGVYPATTRAHVPIMTGGRAITWGSVSDELTHPLRANTMVRALKEAGYGAGLFAAPDLRFGSLADFYRTMPWDRVSYYLDGTTPLTAKDEIHSWGVNEDAMRPLAVEWADSTRRAGHPFFLEFHTIATHHPYGTWGNDRGPGRGDSDRARYANALHYTDAALGRLFDDLDRRGLLRNTLIAVTGDHGEAFAELHPGNLVHRNRLYEENIRNFLVLFWPRIAHGPVASPRIGGHGDILPTILHAAGISPVDVPGQDLLGAGYSPRTQFFYKDTGPAETGLRDGRWKFIGRRDGSAPQLYDLVADPREANNVAAQHPERVAEYRDLVADWYVAENDDFTGNLVGWDSAAHHRVSRSTIGQIVPPALRIGRFTGEPGVGFTPTPRIRPNDAIYVFTRWGFLPEDLTVQLVIVSPSRQVFTKELAISSDWDTSWYRPPLGRAKEEGRWQVSLWWGAQRLAVGTFEVSTKELRALAPAPTH